MNSINLKIFSTIFLVSFNLFAQKNANKFTNLTVKNGLSSNSVFSIIQDKQGFLWFGTSNGIDKYDGYNITVYQHNPFDSNSVVSNNSGNLFCDSKGIIWIGTWGSGLDKFNPYTDKFTHYKYNPNNPNSISSDKIQTIFEDSFGTLWFCTYSGGVSRLDDRDRKEGKFKQYRFNPKNDKSISSNRVRSVAEDNSGALWFATNSGISRLTLQNRERGIFTNYHFSKRKHTINDIVYRTYIGPSNILWAGTINGLYKIKNPGSIEKINDINPIRTFQFKNNVPENFNDSTIFTIYEDKKGYVWLGTGGGGIIKLDPKTGKYKRFAHIPNDPQSLAGNNIRAFYEDRSENLWIGTFDGGISKLDLKQKSFDNYFTKIRSKNKIVNNTINAIWVDNNNNLWAGTDKGLLFVNTSKSKQYTLKYNYIYSKLQNILDSHRITVIYKDKSGTFYFGTNYDGLFVINTQNWKVEHYLNNPNNPKSISDNTIRSIYRKNDNPNTPIWIGTNLGGLNKFDPIKKMFYRYVHMSVDPTSIPNNAILAIKSDHKGNLLIGTMEGLAILPKNQLSKTNTKEVSFLNYKYEPGNPNSLINNEVQAIYESNSGGKYTIWLGTLGGLSKLNLKNNEERYFSNFTVYDGLPSNIIYGILEDDKGNLWLSTGNGLSKFNPVIESFKNFDVEDWISDNRSRFGAYFENLNGKMFFGTNNGITSFYPDSIKDNPYLPTIMFTNFKIHNQPVKLKMPIWAAKKISLNYDQNFFSIEFAALEFTAPYKNRYAYKLENFNNDWINLGSKHDVMFTNLNPGEYNLKVLASNEDGLWTKKAKSLKIVIIPAFWMTLWFKGLALLAILLAVISIYYFRIRTIHIHNTALTAEITERKKTEEKLIAAKEEAQNADRLKSIFLAQMSHEIRTPVNAVVSLSSLLESDLQDIMTEENKTMFSLINKAGNRIIRTIELLLNLSEIQAGTYKMLSQKVNIYTDILTKLFLEYKYFAKEKNLNFSLKIDTDELEIIVDSFTVNQIFVQLIDNAIKYTESGSVNIKVYRNNENKLVVEISDTGIGISKEYLPNLFEPFSQEEMGYTRRYEGNGIGMALVKHYCKMNNATVLVESEKGIGTTVKVIFN